LSAVDLRIAASAGPAGTVISELGGTEPWRPRILAPNERTGWARVALVQTRASLITADDISIEVTVGPGASLELVEIGALVAMNARGGTEARVTACVDVQAGGRLIWLAQPWILSSGAVVDSRLDVSLASEARVLRGESVVLGRAGETPGALTSRARLTVDGVPLLDETLRTGDLAVLRSPVVAGYGAMIAAVTLAGIRDDDEPPGALQAESLATLWRGAGPTVETGATASAVAERWRGLLSRRDEDLPQRVTSHRPTFPLSRVPE
jgi:urease accessory protein